MLKKGIPPSFAYSGKTCLQGYINGCQKSPPSALLRVVFSSSALASTAATLLSALQPTPLRFVRCSKGRGGLFCPQGAQSVVIAALSAPL